LLTALEEYAGPVSDAVRAADAGNEQPLQIQGIQFSPKHL
jgi:hypothetical protein